MPPKRKAPNTATAATLAPRSLKVAKKKHAYVMTFYI